MQPRTNFACGWMALAPGLVSPWKYHLALPFSSDSFSCISSVLDACQHRLLSQTRRASPSICPLPLCNGHVDAFLFPSDTTAETFGQRNKTCVFLLSVRCFMPCPRQNRTASRFRLRVRSVFNIQPLEYCTDCDIHSPSIIFLAA